MTIMTNENINFSRLSHVIALYGGRVLQETLRYVIDKNCPSGTTMSSLIAEPRVQMDLTPMGRRSCLNKDQQKLLYPGGTPSPNVTLQDLDISLAIVLLKNMTYFSATLSQPSSCSSTTLWENPTEAERQSHPIETSVATIRHIRNTNFHRAAPVIPESEFTDQFDKVKSAILELLKAVGSTAVSENEIENMRDHHFAPDVVNKIVEAFVKNKERINLEENQSKLKETMEGLEANLMAKMDFLINMQFQNGHAPSKSMTTRRRACKLEYVVAASAVVLLVVLFIVVIYFPTKRVSESKEAVYVLMPKMNEDINPLADDFKPDADKISQEFVSNHANKVVRVKLKRGGGDVENADIRRRLIVLFKDKTAGKRASDDRLIGRPGPATATPRQFSFMAAQERIVLGREEKATDDHVRGRPGPVGSADPTVATYKVPSHQTSFMATQEPVGASQKLTTRSEELTTCQGNKECNDMLSNLKQEYDGVNLEYTLGRLKTDFQSPQYSEELSQLEKRLGEWRRLWVHCIMDSMEKEPGETIAKIKYLENKLQGLVKGVFMCQVRLIQERKEKSKEKKMWSERYGL